MRYRDGSEVPTLFDYVMKHRKNLQHKKLQIDVANENLYKNKTTKNFQNLMSTLAKDVLDYLAYVNMKSDVNELHLHQLQALNRRGLFDEAVDFNTTYQQEIVEGKIDIWNKMYQLRALHELKYSNNPIKIGRDGEMWNEIIDLWSNLRDELSLFYRVDAANIQKLYNEDLSERINQELKEVDANRKNDLKRILKNLEILTSDEKFEEGHLAEENLIFLENSHETLSSTVATLVLILTILYERRRTKYDPTQLDRLYRLLKIGIDTGHIAYGGRITYANYLAVVNVFCYHEKFEKAEIFINEWRDKIAYHRQDEIYYLAKSLYHIYNLDGDAALEILNGVNFKEINRKGIWRRYHLVACFLAYDNGAFLDSQYANYLSFANRNAQNIVTDVNSKTSGAKLVELLKYVNLELDRQKVKKNYKYYIPNSFTIWTSYYIKKLSSM